MIARPAISAARLAVSWLNRLKEVSSSENSTLSLTVSLNEKTITQMKLDAETLSRSVIALNKSNRLIENSFAKERAGSARLNSSGRFAKWISTSLMLPPSSAQRIEVMPNPASADQAINVGVGCYISSYTGRWQRGPRTRSCRREDRPPRI